MHNKKNVLILGHKGMLGSAVHKEFLNHRDIFNVDVGDNFYYPKDRPDFNKFENWYHWIINCIGHIKPLIREECSESRSKTLHANSIFPYELCRNNPSAWIINATTDCVFSGQKGNYNEKDTHDALDFYGRSKSLGEPANSNCLNLRASIIGFEPNNKRSLIEWFSSRKEGENLYGWAQAKWNGITTIAWAKIAIGIVKNNERMCNVLHAIPADTISKADLLKLFVKYSGRNDLIINDVDFPKIDMTLTTLWPDINWLLWRWAGYNHTPTIEELVKEMFDQRFSA